MKKCLVTLLVLVLMSVHAFAEEGYDYTVTIDGGLYGKTDKTELHFNYGESFDPSEITVTLNDSTDPHIFKGFKISGQETVYPNGFTVTKDVHVVASYGIAGKQVEYTIQYVDANGNEISEADTYWGSEGDEIILPYKYIEGYIPRALNFRINSLVAGRSYSMEYVPGEIQVGENGEIIYVYYDVPGQGGGGAGGGGGVTPTPGGNEEEIPDEQTPQTNPDDVIDIDDPEPPLAPGGDGSEGDGNEGSSIFNGTTLAVAGGVGAVGIVSLFLLLAKKKKEEEEEE